VKKEFVITEQLKEREQMKEAILWEKKNGKIRCELCNHFCLIEEGKTGICGVRLNKNGILYSLVYGKTVAESVDPIEKKPLFHFLPGSLAYSIATVGCNFFCAFCQNSEIAHPPKNGEIFYTNQTTPEKIVKSALSSGCKSISYTYTEPTVFFEFAFDTAKIAKENGIKNNFVTNGYMSKEALKIISPFLDGANVDLKGDENLYKNLCGAKQKPVIENISLMKELGIWVEVTTLIIPEYNDSEKQIEEIAKTIKNIDNSIPWHVTRFYPAYKMANHYPTPVEEIKKAREIGLEIGLKYVYTGNLWFDEGENTYCPSCHKLLIERRGVSILKNNIKDGKCIFCSEKIDGLF